MSETGFPGHRLRQRREELGWTLDQVYLRLRVAPHFIEALEAGELETLPGRTYAAGFVKSYCAFLEEDPNPYLAALAIGPKPAAKRNTPRPMLRTADAPARPSWVNEIVAWGTVVALLIAGWVAYSVVVRPDAVNPGGASAGTLGVNALDHEEMRRPGE